MRSNNYPRTETESVEFEMLEIDVDTETRPESYEETGKDAWLLTGLDTIEEMEKWLRGVWKDCKKGTVDFSTLGHGELQSANAYTPNFLIKLTGKNSLKLRTRLCTQRVHRIFTHPEPERSSGFAST